MSVPWNKGPIIAFYTDPECTKALNPKESYGPCDAGGSQIYDIYARNEGRLPYESYEIRVHASYQVLNENGEFASSKGERYDLQPTMDVQLLRTPRPHRLNPGEVAHIRIEWKPPADCEHALTFTVELEGPFIVSPVD